jgi:hypothetical protein
MVRRTLPATAVARGRSWSFQPREKPRVTTAQASQADLGAGAPPRRAGHDLVVLGELVEIGDALLAGERPAPVAPFRGPLASSSTTVPSIAAKRTITTGTDLISAAPSRRSSRSMPRHW